MDRQAVISGLQKVIEGMNNCTIQTASIYLTEAIKFLQKDEKIRGDLIKFLEQENPYPKNVFPIIKKEDYDKINDYFKKELGYPMDRLSGEMGRRIYVTITDILRGIVR